MAVGIGLMVTLMAAVTTGRHLTAPCSFNSMCSCRTSQTLSQFRNASHWDPQSQLDGDESYENVGGDVSCVGVPFAFFPALPPGKINHVDIVNSGLTVAEIPGFSLKHTDQVRIRVESLRLMSNRIRHVGDQLLKAISEDLRSLDLSYNELDEIPVRSFRSLRALDWANFHSNRLASLEGMGQLWSHLSPTLNALFLGNNDITALSRATQLPTGDDTWDKNSLSWLRQLTWLNLDGNHLMDVPPDSLPSRLHTLSVAHNRIENFPVKTVDSLKDLRWLDLRGNYIRHLPTVSMRSASRVRLDKLDLGENLISVIPEEATLFNRSLHIRDLHLDLNRISHVPSNAFRGLNIARLYLSSNGIASIDPKAFYSLASSLVLLDLDRNHIGQYPRALDHLRKLRFLYLSDNHISSLPSEAFSTFGSHLEALNLASNNLRTCPKESLRNTVRLVHLNLGYNDIDTLQQDCLSSWASNLEVLILRGNRITSLGPRLFVHARRIRELSLTLNKIEKYDETSFIDLAESLETLEMNMAFIKNDFPVGLLQPLRRLQWLSLENNHFEDVVFREGEFLPELHFLSLEGNRLKTVNFRPFGFLQMQQLRDLRLGRNMLETIETGTFADLPEVTTISLMANRIDRVHRHSFDNLPKLMTVTLSHNRIELIDASAFRNLNNLFKIDLQFNRLREFTWDVFDNCTNAFTSSSLNVSNNQISLWKEHIDPSRSLLFLKTIDLSRNRLTQLPAFFLTALAPRTLKRLYLNNNKIERISDDTFSTNCEELQILELQQNALHLLGKDAFSRVENLQILDLSFNKMEVIPSGLFGNLPRLRVVNLSRNRLRFLPRDLFENTSVDTLDLSHNHINAWPVSSLNPISPTLTSLDMSHNLIDHLDSVLLAQLPNLVHLNLAHNRLTLLSDNVFSYLTNLVTLDLSFNGIRANFKELFHYLQKVKELNLAGVGLTKWPHLALPALITLNLSSNSLDQQADHNIFRLDRLRSLDLSKNHLNAVPSFIWQQTPLLKQVDLSHNPIKSVGRESFMHLGRLQVLKLSPLQSLENIDVDSFRPLVYLTTLHVQNWKGPHLSQLTKGLHGIRRLVLDVKGSVLNNQLNNVADLEGSPKLRDVELTGTHLKSLHPQLLSNVGFKFLSECSISLRHTGIQHISDGFLHGLEGCVALKLDLRDNALHSFAAHSFGDNTSRLINRAKQLTGGLLLNNNPWICTCENYWLGTWLKRWMVETSATRSLSTVESEEVLCTEARSGRKRLLVSLSPSESSCSVAALSAGATCKVDSSVSSYLVKLTFLLLSVIQDRRVLYV